MLRECRMQKAECRINIPKSLLDRVKNPHSAFRIPQSKGVTLIEVILTMVIIGILSATVISRIDFTLPTTVSVDGAAYIIASDIRYVQECAMANRVSKGISFTSGQFLLHIPCYDSIHQ